MERILKDSFEPRASQRQRKNENIFGVLVFFFLYIYKISPL